MFLNHIKIIFRTMLRNKLFSLINISGLAVGIACTLLILLWVRYELDYDHFHEHLDEICRVVVDYDGFRIPTTAGPMAKFLQDEIPEIFVATRFKMDKSVLTYGDKSIRIFGLNAEPSFMDIFTFPSVEGDAKSALDDAQSIVITESAARRLFGDEEAIGKVVKLSNRWTAKIAAIIKDVPDNSSPPLRFEYLAPFKTYYFWRDPDSWTANSDYYTWLKLVKNVPLKTVNEKIDELIKRHDPDPKLHVFLQPLKEIHLNANTDRWDGPHGDMQYVIIFSLLAGIILAIACINFMNLSTARSMVRAKEVGVRKIVGAGRYQLIIQFFGESFLYTLLALPVAGLIVELSLPGFNQLLGHHYIFELSNPWIPGMMGLILIVTGFLAGLYPALFLSSFKPIRVLKHTFLFSGRNQDKDGNFSLRKALVIFQFTLAIMVIIGTITIYRQLTFIQNKNLGFDKDNLLYVALPNNYPPENYQTLKNELTSNSKIASVGGSDQIPTATDFIPETKWKIHGEEKSAGWPAFIVDEDFIDTYKIKLIQGRKFSGEFPGDYEGAFIVNQAAVKKLGFKDPLGKNLEVYHRQGKIVGVIQDFHFEAFREEIEPLILMLNKQCVLLNIRITGGDVPRTIDEIKEATQKLYPGSPFIFRFLDDEIQQLYMTEQRMGTIFSYFSFLAIFISCLGLYGLISFLVERKTKEIGIRKVLGASILKIVKLLSFDFLKWILIANVIAWPLAWLMMRQWLQNYAYRISMQWWMFLAAGIITIVVALITVSWQAFKAAKANPVDSLRYE